MNTFNSKHSFLLTSIQSPSAPFLISISDENASAIIYFNQPLYNPFPPILNYYHTSTYLDGYINGALDISTVITPYTITNLINGTTYSVKLQASNVSGRGPFSNILTVTPCTIPDPPIITQIITGLSGTTYVGSGKAYIHYSLNETGGSIITSYVLEYSLSSTFATPIYSKISITTNPYFIETPTNLTDGYINYFRMYAINKKGTSPPSIDVSAITMYIPDPPTFKTITTGISGTTLVGSGKANIYYSPPNNHGSDILYYTLIYGIVSSANQTTISNITLNPIILTGLTDGSGYTAEIYATNSIGPSNLATYSPFIPSTTPNVPMIKWVKDGNNTVDISVASYYNGGNNITKYNIIYSIDSTFSSDVSNINVTALKNTILGLSNEYTYYFKAAAVNNNGFSDYSITVSGIPYTTPPPPTITNIVTGISETTLVGSKKVIIYFSPNGTGGRPITRYTLQYSLSSGFIPVAGAINTILSSPYTSSGLSVTDGIGYYYRISAFNVSIGLPSSSVYAITSTIPSKMSFTVTPSNEFVRVNYSAVTGTNTGGSDISNYFVYVSTSYISIITVLTPSATLASTVYTYDSSTLINGTLYHFAVVAGNANGKAQTFNDVSAIPFRSPSVPIGINTSYANKQINVNFTAATDNGGFSPITYYLSISPSGDSNYFPTTPITTLSTTTTSFTINSTTATPITISNGTMYYMSILSQTTNKNSGTYYGNALKSSSVSITPVTPSTVPDSPTLNVVTGISGTTLVGSGNAIITYSSNYNGGSAILDFSLNYSITGGTTNSIVLPIANTSTVITGLTDGSATTFNLYARNKNGYSNVSFATETPSTIPPTPSFIVYGGKDKNDITLVGSQKVNLYPTTSNGTGGATMTYRYNYTIGGVTYEISDLSSSTYNSTTPIIISNGLVNGTPTIFYLYAVNSNGTSEPSSYSATPAYLPITPNLIIEVGTTSAGDLVGSKTALVSPSYTGSSLGVIGGLPINSYLLRYTDPAGVERSNTFTNPISVSTGLVDGTQTTFYLYAINSLGNSATPAIVSATPSTVPPRPSLTLLGGKTTGGVSIGSNTLYLYPTSNGDGGATMTYYYYYSAQGQDSGLSSTTYTASNPIVLVGNGLVDGTSTTVYLSAFNSNGRIDHVYAAATPYISPSAPSFSAITTGTAAGGTVIVRNIIPTANNSTSIPHNGGSPITSYTLTVSPTGTYGYSPSTISTTANTDCTITGLANGTQYTIKLTATNASFTGPETTITTTPSGVPNQPTSVTFVAKFSTIVLTITSPSFFGGTSTISGYKIYYSTDTTYSSVIDTNSAISTVNTASTHRIINLLTGTPYYIRVTAYNSNGESSYVYVNSAQSITPVLASFSNVVIGKMVIANKLLYYPLFNSGTYNYAIVDLTTNDISYNVSQLLINGVAGNNAYPVMFFNYSNKIYAIYTNSTTCSNVPGQATVTTGSASGTRGTTTGSSGSGNYLYGKNTDIKVGTDSRGGQGNGFFQAQKLYLGTFTYSSNTVTQITAGSNNLFDTHCLTAANMDPNGNIYTIDDCNGGTIWYWLNNSASILSNGENYGNYSTGLEFGVTNNMYFTNNRHTIQSYGYMSTYDVYHATYSGKNITKTNTPCYTTYTIVNNTANTSRHITSILVYNGYLYVALYGTKTGDVQTSSIEKCSLSGATATYVSTTPTKGLILSMAVNPDNGILYYNTYYYYSNAYNYTLFAINS